MTAQPLSAPAGRRSPALILGAALIAWNGWVNPRVPPQWHPLPHAVLGAALVTVTRAPLGLRPPQLWRGLRYGGGAVALVAAVVTVGTAVPAVRGVLAARRPPAAPLRWLLLGIPVGTVWSEEAAFRAALGVLADDAFGRCGGQLFGAVVFGLSHFAVVEAAPADAGPEAPGAAPAAVAATVVVTGLAGWVFDWLYRRSGSLAGSMLAHLATNEAGALAALAVQRRLRRSS